MLADYLKKDDAIYEYNNHYDVDDYIAYSFYNSNVFQSEESSVDEDEIPF